MAFTTKEFQNGVTVPLELTSCPVCLKPLIARLPTDAGKIQDAIMLTEKLETFCSSDSKHRPPAKNQPITDWHLHDRWSYIKLIISRQWEP